MPRVVRFGMQRGSTILGNGCLVACRNQHRGTIKCDHACWVFGHIVGAGHWGPRLGLRTNSEYLGT